MYCVSWVVSKNNFIISSVKRLKCYHSTHSSSSLSSSPPPIPVRPLSRRSRSTAEKWPNSNSHKNIESSVIRYRIDNNGLLARKISLASPKLLWIRQRLDTIQYLMRSIHTHDASQSRSPSLSVIWYWYFEKWFFLFAPLHAVGGFSFFSCESLFHVFNSTTIAWAASEEWNEQKKS